VTATISPSVLGFELRLGGREAAGGFCRVDGLGCESRVSEHAEIDAHGGTRVIRVASRETWADIVLARPLDASLVLWQWRRTVMRDGVDAARVSGSVALLDGTGTALAEFRFEHGWPARYRVTGLEDAFGAVLEEVHIAHEGLDRIR
jgi:phage tail-like protein